MRLLWPVLCLNSPLRLCDVFLVSSSQILIVLSLPAVAKYLPSWAQSIAKIWLSVSTLCHSCLPVLAKNWNKCPFVFAAKTTAPIDSNFSEAGRHLSALTGVFELDSLSLTLVLSSAILVFLRRLQMRTYPSLVAHARRESSCANLASMISALSLMGILRLSFCLSCTFSKMLVQEEVTEAHYHVSPFVSQSILISLISPKYKRIQLHQLPTHILHSHSYIYSFIISLSTTPTTLPIYSIDLTAILQSQYQ